MTVFVRDRASGGLAPTDGYRGCGPTSSFLAVPGDRVVVRVTASFSPLTPLVSALTGSPITIARSQEVVVQG